MSVVLLKMIVFAFLINLAWEIGHSGLYTTCREMDAITYRKLMLLMSAKDSVVIAVFYSISAIIFRNPDIFANLYQLVLFISLSLLFSFMDERISLKLKRWQYAPTMPVLFGVGLTPLLEIAVTGLLVFYFVFI